MKAISLLLLLGTHSLATAGDALHAVNAKREAVGLYHLEPDPELQKWAQFKADKQAHDSRVGHVFRGPWPGKREGAGVWSQRRGGRWIEDHEGLFFHACSMATGHRSGRWGNYRRAGAAVSVSRRSDGTVRNYYCLILR